MAEGAEGGQRVELPVRLRWSDLDAYGHVNNATVLTLLEDVRIRALWKGDDDGEDRPLAIVNAGEHPDTLTLIARHEIEYLAPIPFGPEPIRVELWISKIGAASADVAYEIRSPDGATRHVIAESTIVFLDAVTERPRRLRPEEREAWGPYLGPPPAFRGGRRRERG